MNALGMYFLLCVVAFWAILWPTHEILESLKALSEWAGGAAFLKNHVSSCAKLTRYPSNPDNISGSRFLRYRSISIFS